MRDAAPDQSQTVIHLADYAPVPVTVTHVDLHLRLDPLATEVSARLTCRRQGPGVMVLNGEGLDMVSLAIDGVPLEASRYMLTDTTLTLHDVPDAFLLETVARIAPQENKALEGLYMSNGMYCTQCEAEGFRKITWMLDRPDVMATYDVEIEADLPVLLSNGDEVAPGKWHDPWPKPTYLFALVAGNLVATTDQFTTCEGRAVTLNIWVRPGDEGRTAYAMDALKRSMAWDETVYGRAYDLSVFNIVAVDDFNMGAMENKGLNIFNSKYVLASPDTATDTDFALIEGIVAHEYFHNWTGNRITCRDWFQLCLKEGLTVFRDQQFSADMRSAPVQRIGDVLQLRARQFREDAGPLAHPVRPESFVEINNFYTATVYEKGAEVIGMLRRLVGDAGYAAGCALYFERHDGQACTIEDWLACFEEATGRDLSQFKLWYSQAGTPLVSVTESYGDGTYRLTLRQTVPDTPGQTDKAPMVIPVAWGLLNTAGDEVRPTEVLELTEAETTLTFDLDARPVLSVLRGFSAPVRLEYQQSDTDRLTLLAHDTDPFNRWEAGRALSKDRLLRHITEDAPFDAAWLDALAAVALNDGLDPAFRALALALPSEDDLAQSLHDAGVVPDPTAIHAARKRAFAAVADRLATDLPRLMDDMATPGPYTPEASDAGKRALRAVVLRLLTTQDGGGAARATYDGADNMTDRMAAFTCLLEAGDPNVADQFEAQWSDDRLVMDKWFMARVAHAEPTRAVQIARDLTARPDFDANNPNRVRSVLGGLTAGNPAGFHNPDGSGYEFLAEWLLILDKSNPQTAARLSTAFDAWRRYDADRQALISAALTRLQGQPLSRDLSEMVGRILGSSSATEA
ncbi:aminopeptidase N [Jannaschia pagri]|uniref:Aminopeptidase N n=1 Tax=Jannaschia pagri TaxID=2829797 RepID=A0ABQ4NP10_9RHOB|nr:MULTISPECIES: aminopeptidase N [unclassified Jannaschia]GIT92306.1 aminopeptidase N [Jannaschia sp. AI_61]GIT96141.1 aminopeptidase N [Jannaschia sp. AI_62]